MWCWGERRRENGGMKDGERGSWRENWFFVRINSVFTFSCAYDMNKVCYCHYTFLQFIPLILLIFFSFLLLLLLLTQKEKNRERRVQGRCASHQTHSPILHPFTPLHDCKRALFKRESLPMIIRFMKRDLNKGQAVNKMRH